MTPKLTMGLVTESTGCADSDAHGALQQTCKVPRRPRARVYSHSMRSAIAPFRVQQMWRTPAPQVLVCISVTWAGSHQLCRSRVASGHHHVGHRLLLRAVVLRQLLLERPLATPVLPPLRLSRDVLWGLAGQYRRLRQGQLGQARGRHFGTRGEHELRERVLVRGGRDEGHALEVGGHKDGLSLQRGGGRCSCVYGGTCMVGLT